MENSEQNSKTRLFVKTVIEFFDPKCGLPQNSNNGDTYICTRTDNEWCVNKLYEYRDCKWHGYIPENGQIVWVQRDRHGETLYVFNGLTWEKIAKTINHFELGNIGKYTHNIIDNHIDNKNMHISEKMISHTRINDIGTFSHTSIDKHIHNSENAHFGQDLTRNGNPTFKSLRVIDTTMASHVVTKDYVDTKICGVKWNKSVKEFIDPKCGLPTDVIQGDRYICISSYNEWKKDNIYEYENNEWREIIPTRDYAVHVETGSIYNGDNVLYNGNEWIKFGSTTNHENMSGIGINTHTDIDKHIFDTKNAHFGQDLGVSGSPIFSNVRVTEQLVSNYGIVKNQVITDGLQIGKYTLNSSQNGDPTFAISGDNNDVNLMFIRADISSIEPINLIHMRARGTIDKPEALLCGTAIGSLVYSGHDGSTYKMTSNISCVTTEDYDTLKHGSAIYISTTKNNTNEPTIKLKIDHDGKVECYCTNESTPQNEGSLIVHGGININKNAIIGGTLNLCENIQFSNVNSSILTETIEGFDNRVINICGGGTTNNKRGGIVSVSGVDSVMDGTVNINAGIPNGNIKLITGNTQQLTISKTGYCIIHCTHNSINTNTGALQVMGGVGVSNDIHLGGNIVGDNNEFTICGNNMHLFSSGCLKFETSDYDDSKIIFGNKNGNNCEITNSGIWNFQNTETSTSIDSGSVIIDGGVGIKKKLCVSELQCINMFQLPYVTTENCKLGSMYYDIDNDCVCVYTKHGWRSIDMK